MRWRGFAFAAIALLAALLGLGNKIVRCMARDGTAHLELAHPAGTCAHSDPDDHTASQRTCARTSDDVHQEALVQLGDCEDIGIFSGGVTSPRRVATPIPSNGVFARIPAEPVLGRCVQAGWRKSDTGPPRVSSWALLRRCTVLLI